MVQAENTEKGEVMKVYTGRRGQSFEMLLDYTNRIYQNQGRCLIQKRPTPVKVLRTQGKRITSAVHEAKSTVDYDGLYRSRAIVFEAKSTKLMRFPLDMLADHQIKYLNDAEKHGAVSFVIIEMRAIQKVFIVPNVKIQEYVLNAKKGGRKSIPIDDLEDIGFIVESSNGVPLDYLKYIDEKVLV